MKYLRTTDSQQYISGRQSTYTKVLQCTEAYFSSFLSDELITAIVVNPTERKLANCTSVWCAILFFSANLRWQLYFQSLWNKNIYLVFTTLFLSLTKCYSKYRNCAIIRGEIMPATVLDFQILRRPYRRYSSWKKYSKTLWYIFLSCTSFSIPKNVHLKALLYSKL